MSALTELTALPNEARPAGALAAYVVAVGAVLAAAHLSTLGAIETRRTTCGGGERAWRFLSTSNFYSVSGPD